MERQADRQINFWLSKKYFLNAQRRERERRGHYSISTLACTLLGWLMKTDETHRLTRPLLHTHTYKPHTHSLTLLFHAWQPPLTLTHKVPLAPLSSITHTRKHFNSLFLISSVFVFSSFFLNFCVPLLSFLFKSNLFLSLPNPSSLPFQFFPYPNSLSFPSSFLILSQASFHFSTATRSLSPHPSTPSTHNTTLSTHKCNRYVYFTPRASHNLLASLWLGAL